MEESASPDGQLRRAALVPGDRKRLIAYSDGASRGNPGRAAIGAVVIDDHGQTLAEVSRVIGRGTNNEAEYRAAIAAVEAAIGLGATSVELRMDSELIVRQFSGRYRVRNPALMRHFQRLDALRRQLQHLQLIHVPREQNRVADRLANRALDRGSSD